MPKMRSGQLALALCTLTIASLIMAPVLAAPNLATVEKELKDALAKQDEMATGAALQRMAAVGGAKAMRALIELTDKYTRKLEGGQYWQLVGSMAAFRDAEALEALGDFIVTKEKTALARDALFALQNNASHHVFKVHEKVLKKGSFEQKLLTVDQLAEMKRVESGDLLIAALETEKPEVLRQRIINALATMTNKDLGDAENWIGWWKANRDKEPFKEEDSESAGTGSVTRDGARGREMTGSMERLNKGRVLVIVGGACCATKGAKAKAFDHNYDHIESTLESIGIKAEPINKTDFAKLKPTDLKDVMAILINCTQNNEHCICPTCVPTGATNMRMQTCGNCDKHIVVKDTMPKEGIDLIKTFVENGGYFFSEDWGLYEIIEKAWPSIVKVGTFLREADKMPTPPAGGGAGGGGGGRDMTALPKGGQVKVTPAPGATSHPYMRGVFLKPGSDRAKEPIGEGTVERGATVGSEFRAPEHTWTIDDDSPSVRIVDASKVKILLRSDELDKLTKGDATAAFMFAIGKDVLSGGGKDGRRPTTGKGSNADRISSEEAVPGGRVLHVLSHFGKQSSAVDEAALKNLLVNFMLECSRRRAPQ